MRIELLRKLGRHLRVSTFIPVLALAALSCGATAAAAADIFAPLEQRLLKDGFPKHQIFEVYHPAPPPMFKTVSQTLRMRESQLNYDQFLKPSNVAKGIQFLGGHESTLKEAEHAYGVDRHVIVSILLIETQLGHYTGQTPTLAILSTFALLDRKEHRDKIWALLSPQDRKKWDRAAFDRKLTERAQWAYQELCALLQWTEAQGKRPEIYRGSVMGAIGWPQFLPSSLLRYGADGNGDGRVDLFQSGDAIFSIANYLRAHGWLDAKTREDQEGVVYYYNRSRPYVRTVLNLAARLRDGM